MTEHLSQSELLFLGLAAAFFPLELAYFGWRAWQAKARKAIEEGNLVLPWQQGYTTQSGLAVAMDLLVLMVTLGLLAFGYLSQPWMRDLASILVSALTFPAIILAIMLAVGWMVERSSKHEGE